MIVLDPRRGTRLAPARRDLGPGGVDHVLGGEPAADGHRSRSVSNYPAIMASAGASARARCSRCSTCRPPRRQAGGDTAEFNEQIEFRGISFEYEASEAVLRDVDLEVKPAGRCDRGSVRSGEDDAGRPLAAVLQPTRGEILLDGVPLTPTRATSLRRLMGIDVAGDGAAQRHGAREHRLWSEACCPLEQVRERRARAANADESSCGCPTGYHHTARRTGTRLSGRARPAHCDARALLRDPPILISRRSDQRARHRIGAARAGAIERLMAHRTVFVIAHPPRDGCSTPTSSSCWRKDASWSGAVTPSARRRRPVSAPVHLHFRT